MSLWCSVPPLDKAISDSGLVDTDGHVGASSLASCETEVFANSDLWHFWHFSFVKSYPGGCSIFYCGGVFPFCGKKNAPSTLAKDFFEKKT
jgi:hypothetical protein